MAAEAGRKGKRKDADMPSGVKEKRTKAEKDSQDEIGDALSSDIKGILKAIETVKERTQASSKKQSSERLASLSKDVKINVETVRAKVEKESESLRKHVGTTRQFETRLKQVTDSFEKDVNEFKASCSKYQQDREKIVAEFENFKEKLDRKIEQQRRKDKTEYANLQKSCAEKLREAEDILSTQKKEAKSINVLRKSLGTILQDSDEGLEDTEYEE